MESNGSRLLDNLVNLNKNVKNKLFNAFGMTLEEFEEKASQPPNFLATIADFNNFLIKFVRHNNDINLNVYDGYNQIRHSVVHNKITYKDGHIITENGAKIPYNMFYELLNKQELVLNQKSTEQENENQK